jgi:hypothetical protein
MSVARIEGTGSDVDQVIANLREKLDEQFGADRWHLAGSLDEPENEDGLVLFAGPDPVEIDIRLSPGGVIASVHVTLTVEAEGLSTLALPRAARA